MPDFTADSNIIYDGIDVSNYQGDIDFAQVRSSGIEAVYIKAGEGGNMTDPFFLQNYERASAADMIVGFYYYVTAFTTAEAAEQAQHFYELIRDKNFSARPAMDYESFSNPDIAAINAIGLTFLRELERLSGVRPMIYSDASDAQTIWSNDFSIYPLWIADYYSTNGPAGNDIWEHQSGFQYSDTGSVLGISGDVDMDYFTDSILVPALRTDS